jgi:hypothetical protein
MQMVSIINMVSSFGTFLELRISLLFGLLIIDAKKDVRNLVIISLSELWIRQIGSGIYKNKIKKP